MGSIYTPDISKCCKSRLFFPLKTSCKIMKESILHTVLCFIWHGMPDLGFPLRLGVTEPTPNMAMVQYPKEQPPATLNSMRRV